MTLPDLTFECYQMESGVWCKRRHNGLRGACVADEALLWQHLQAAQAALGQKPPARVNIEELVRENEQLTKDCERLVAEKHDLRATCDRITRDCAELMADNEHLRANQRQKPGRKPRRSDAAGAEDQALAAPEQECNPLDEDL